MNVDWESNRGVARARLRDNFGSMNSAEPRRQSLSAIAARRFNENVRSYSVDPNRRVVSVRVAVAWHLLRRHKYFDMKILYDVVCCQVSSRRGRIVRMEEDAIDRIVHQWNRERPKLDVSATHVLQRISRLFCSRAQALRRSSNATASPFGEFEVLAALLRSGPPYQMSPTRLVDAVVLSSGAMTNRIDRVEALGLVERLPDPSDRRGTLVALTREGRQTVDAAVVAHLANEERLLGALSSTERGTIARLLRKLLLSEPFAAHDAARTRDGGPRTTRRQRATNGFATARAARFDKAVT